MEDWGLTELERKKKDELLELAKKNHGLFLRSALQVEMPYKIFRCPGFRFSDVHSYNYEKIQTAYGLEGSLNASLIEDLNGPDFIAMEYPTRHTNHTADELIHKSKCEIVISLIGDHPVYEMDFLKISHKLKTVFSPAEFLAFVGHVQGKAVEFLDSGLLKENAHNLMVEMHVPEKEESKKVFRIKCMDWRDKMPTSENSIKVLDAVYRACLLVREHSGPVIVHCLAGVGRTGTFIFYNMFTRMLKSGRILEEERLSCFLQLFMYLRSRRTYMVESSTQLGFLCKLFLQRAKPPHSSNEENKSSAS
ncbi:uncharacterized protein NEMAJ01_1056 [Nematocida major]|uniref:uncharacterized protein n=1 Tax=Nematocida major TaxID=1912982 RepID=UPI00200794E8|nr:uncharacterized protein NEMAJ01_1056 [Nematocida major]KAH9386160.1 hypothetical protein NEMAJ01_1056 [Nematocida major]